MIKYRFLVIALIFGLLQFLQLTSIQINHYKVRVVEPIAPHLRYDFYQLT